MFCEDCFANSGSGAGSKSLRIAVGGKRARENSEMEDGGLRCGDGSHVYFADAYFASWRVRTIRRDAERRAEHQHSFKGS